MAVSMNPHPAGFIAPSAVREVRDTGRLRHERAMMVCGRCGRAVHYHARTGRWRHGIEPGYRIIDHV